MIYVDYNQFDLKELENMLLRTKKMMCFFIKQYRNITEVKPMLINYYEKQIKISRKQKILITAAINRKKDT